MRIFLSGIIATIILVVLNIRVCHADTLSSNPDSLQLLAPKIFIDCYDCGEDDYDYFRTEISFVNFVRERLEADIYILITSQNTGGGGWEITFEFKGQKVFEGMSDTLKHFTAKSDTDDMIRAEAVRIMKLGLLRYAAKTPLAGHLTVGYEQPSNPIDVVDKWDYWVFEASIDGWIDGDESYHRFLNNIGFSAERITKERKFTLSGWMNYDETKHETEDFKSLSISRGKGANFWYIWSLGERWSAGTYGSIYSSSYNNQELGGTAAGLIEYNFFPYSESTRRLFCLIWRLAGHHIDYYETTIYEKNNEWLASGRISLALDVKRPWGSISSSLLASSYLHDFKKNRLQLNTQLSIRIIKGLSFNISSYASRVRDQISLTKRGLSKEEILLRKREMATSYSYWASFGLSYTFGSIYNNIVNPRLEN